MDVHESVCPYPNMFGTHVSQPNLATNPPCSAEGKAEMLLLKSCILGSLLPWGNEDTLILRYGVPAEQAPVVSLLMEIIAQWSHPGDHQIKMMTNNYPPDGFSFITYCWKLQALPWYKSLTACSWVFLRHKCWLASPE